MRWKLPLCIPSVFHCHHSLNSTRVTRGCACDQTNNHCLLHAIINTIRLGQQQNWQDQHRYTRFYTTAAKSFHGKYLSRLIVINNKIVFNSKQTTGRLIRNEIMLYSANDCFYEWNVLCASKIISTFSLWRMI